MMRIRNNAFFIFELEKVLKKPLQRINDRLSKINQQSVMSNRAKSRCILLVVIFLGVVYGLMAVTLFHRVWYHKVLSLISTILFMYLSADMYFEIMEKRIKKDIPSTIKILSHYYTHYQGNIIATLNDTVERCSEHNKVFMVRLRDALTASDCENQVTQLEAVMPTIWLKMLCKLMLFAKENGGGNHSIEADGQKADVIARNLKRLNNIIMQQNIEQEYNDAELLGMQLFVFIFPYITVPVSQWYNSSLLRDMNINQIYDSVQAQSLAAIMLIISNLGAVFIHWMRKLQN